MRRRGQLLVLALALFLTLAFAGHALWTALVVTQRPAPVEPWMTPGLIEKTYGIAPYDLAAVLNLDPDVIEGQSLAEIAEAEGVPVDELRATLSREIAVREHAE